MAWMRLSAGLCVTLAVANAASPSALVADDACAPGSGDQACAFSALQVQKQRGGESAPSKSAASGRSGYPFDDGESFLPLDFFTDAVPPGPHANDWKTKPIASTIGKWEYDKQEFMEQWGFPEYARTAAVANSVTGPSTDFFTGERGCENWAHYYWPRQSFWAQEFKRREALVNVGDAEAQAKLQDWTNKAAFMVCSVSADPRKVADPTTQDGKKQAAWSKATNDVYRKVHESEDPWFFPKLGKHFYKELNSLGTPANSECFFWVKQNMCETVYWSDVYKGHMDYGDGYCWDTVEHPPWGFTSYNISMSPGPPRPPDVPELHPEYLKCQERELGEDYFGSVCPLGGHYPKGFMGQNWGTGPPQEVRPPMIQCQAKLGGAPRVELFHFLLPWDPAIGLMNCDPGFYGCVPMLGALVHGAVDKVEGVLDTMIKNATGQTLDLDKVLSIVKLANDLVSNTPGHDAMAAATLHIFNVTVARAMSAVVGHMTEVHDAAGSAPDHEVAFATMERALAEVKKLTSASGPLQVSRLAHSRLKNSLAPG
mmetsp:Transcript_64988/g.170164  ORF Transcript_64988/g.170164 Transcript_64988/m.170164 type:complete len:540 (-) Transcript_64988:8-1627(-)